MSTIRDRSLPGFTEPTTAQRLAIVAARSMKARKPQKDCNEGLFDQHGQTDITDFLNQEDK